MPKETLKKMLLFSSVENKIIVEKIVASTELNAPDRLCMRSPFYCGICLKIKILGQ